MAHQIGGPFARVDLPLLRSSLLGRSLLSRSLLSCSLLGRSFLGRSLLIARNYRFELRASAELRGLRGLDLHCFTSTWVTA